MCIMKTGILFLFILVRLSVRGLPLNEEDVSLSNCIEMTPEKQEEIHNITEEVAIFIQNLSDKYQEIDFTLFNLMIEKHSHDEHEEKETILKVIINDCKNAIVKTKEYTYLTSANIQPEKIRETEETDSDVHNKSTELDLENSKKSFKESNKESSTASMDNKQIQSNSELIEHRSESDSENQISKSKSIENTSAIDYEKKQSQSKPSSEDKINENENDSEIKISRSEPMDETSKDDSENKKYESESLEEITDKDTEKETLKTDKNNNVSKLITQYPDNEETSDENDIEMLNKEFDEVNDVNYNDKGHLYIFAPTIDNSKIEVTNNNGESKDLNSSLLEKLINIEREIENLKQIKCNGDRNGNVYSPGFSGIGLSNYGPKVPTSNVYAQPGFEVIYL